MSNETVYLIDVCVRAADCPDDQIRDFLEQSGFEVLACNGNEDYDFEE